MSGTARAIGGALILTWCVVSPLLAYRTARRKGLRAGLIGPAVCVLHRGPLTVTASPGRPFLITAAGVQRPRADPSA